MEIETVIITKDGSNVRDGPKDTKTREVKQKIKAAINSNKTFLNFLKENKIYGRYVKNTVNSLIQSTHKISYITDMIKQDFNPINCAFIWAKTSEKHGFWKKYNLAYTTIKNKEKY